LGEFLKEFSKKIGIKNGGFFLWKYVEKSKNWLIPLLNPRNAKDSKITIGKL